MNWNFVPGWVIKKFMINYLVQSMSIAVAETKMGDNLTIGQDEMEYSIIQLKTYTRD